MQVESDLAMYGIWVLCSLLFHMRRSRVRLGWAGVELGRCSVWNDEGAVGIPSKFERSTLDIQR